MQKLPSKDKNWLTEYIDVARKAIIADIARRVIVRAYLAFTFFVVSVLSLFLGGPVDIAFTASILYTFFLLADVPIEKSKGILLPIKIDYGFVVSAGWFLASVMMHVTVVLQKELEVYDYYYQSTLPMLPVTLMAIAFACKNSANRGVQQIEDLKNAEVSVELVRL